MVYRLYDQIVAFDWIQKYISGFGGDPNDITAIGQSAGAASLSLHNSRTRGNRLYDKAIVLSGSTTALVTMTPAEHQAEFLHQAEKLGIDTSCSSVEEIAMKVVEAPVDAIRGLNYCGVPCSGSELIPDHDWATMQHARHATPNTWLKSQILSFSTYDGSISYLVAKGQERTQLGKIFAAICRKRMRNPQKLLDLYQISAGDDDDVALEKICHLVTDVGFYGAAVNGLRGAESSKTQSHLVLFDIGNPFLGLLDQGRFATHTWDIISLLGAYDNMVPEDVRIGISEWRRSVLNYCNTGTLTCGAWRSDKHSALRIHKGGIERLDHIAMTNCKAQKLLQLAKEEGEEHGLDMLWENVIRFFLKTGNPRYSHEAATIIEDAYQS